MFLCKNLELNSGNKKVWLKWLQTIFGALFGIQSDKHRQDDFAKQKPINVVFVGVATVIVLLLTMMLIVSVVLP
jgi:hypothetical protein